MKHFTSLFIVSMMVCSLAVQAKNTKVTTKNEFTAAFNALTDGDTLTVNYNGGQILKAGTVTMPSAGGRFYLRGEDPDSLPVLQLQINGVNLPDGTTCGLIFEHLHLQYRSPGASSGQIIYFNGVYANIDSLVFRNCEISESVRSLFRSVKPSNTEEETYTSCGDIDYFEMSNCLVHSAMYPSGNNWPLVYYGHLPVELVFRNNTFYDMPYIKSIFTMNYADPEQGRNASILFENNTVFCTSFSDGMIAPKNYLGESAEYIFRNNLIALPNWVNDLNLPDTSYTAPRLLVTKYGFVQAENNVIQGYRNWRAGQVLDSEGNGDFLSLDTVPQFTMAELGVSFDDFTDPVNGDFSYLYTNPLATAGKDGGPVGDPRWVLRFTNPRSLTVEASIEAAEVSPAKGVYEEGAEVTVTVSEVVGYAFRHWTDKDGNVVSTANPYTFNITTDLELTAVYDELSTRSVTINLKGTNTATYTITPEQDAYYVGDRITIFLNTHGVNEFRGWDDAVSTLSRTVTLTDNVNLTARFKQLPYVMVWDFDHLTANNQNFTSLPANHTVDEANPGVMYYVAADTVSTFSSRNNKFTGKELNFCMIRRTPAVNFDNPDYMVIGFSTKGLTQVGIRSKLASDNCIYQVQKIQYSLDKTSWEDVASITLPADTTFNQVWYDLNGKLPVVAENQDSVFVRWIADPTSARSYLSTSDQSYEYAYISMVVVTAAEDMGGASWRVNPIADYLSGEVIRSVPGIRLTLGGGTNTFTVGDSVITLGTATYLVSINGSANPVDANNKTFSNSGNPPVTGTFYKFDVDVDGVLEVAVIVNADKTSYILENNTALPDYNGFTVPAKTYTSYTFQVKGGSSYYVFSQGSKMGLMGFIYTPSVGLNQAVAHQGIYVRNGSLFVEAVKEGPLAIYDLSGRLVQSLRLQPGTNEISGLKQGVYLLQQPGKTVKVML